MKPLQFVHTREVSAYCFGQEVFLFNHPVFLQMRTGKWGEPLSFFALRANRPVAAIHFFLQGDEAVSLPDAPFGSLETGDLTDEEIAAMLYHAIEVLKSYQLKSVLIRDCISAYRDGRDLTNIFLRSGFRQSEVMINHHIPVDAQLLHEKMHRMEQKRLRKCRRAGFVFRQEPIAQLPEHFTFLQNCRQEKGWQLSMTLDEIKEMTHAFPQTYRLFSVYDGGRRVAASLSVLIRSDLLYDFYHDSPGEYRSFSPVTLLLQSMYAYCREQGIRLLDMGTSPAVSLQQFKAHMGGVGSQKKSYYLRLND